MKAIFLDIDGVIALEEQFMRNRPKFWKKHEWAKELGVPYPFDEKCVALLNEIIEETNAEIVISSDWRLHWDLVLMAEIFTRNGIKKMPRSMTKNMPVSMSWLEKNRANEIEAFISHFDLKQFVILDDLDLSRTFKTKEAVDRFVRTKDTQGLKEVNIKQKVIDTLTRV